VEKFCKEPEQVKKKGPHTEIVESSALLNLKKTQKQQQKKPKTPYLQNHGLEKISKIIKSNHQPNTTMQAKPYPEVPHLHGF